MLQRGLPYLEMTYFLDKPSLQPDIFAKIKDPFL